MVILEVGLGGRLDAVNCVAADVAVLTSIGLDHCDYLGNTRELIGYEKAGIFRSGAPAVSGEPDLPHTVTEFAAAQQVPLLQVNRDYFYTVAEQSWNYQCGAVDWSGLPLPQLPLANAATALTALLQLGIELDLISVEKVLTSAQLAGRLEFRAGSPDVLLDVAHNPHAAAFLAATLNQRFPQRPIIAVVGMLRDKDYKNTLAELQPLVQHWCLATLGEPRGATAEMLATDWPQQASTYTLHDTVSDAYQAALAQAKKDSAANPLVLVFGSFYTVGKIQPEG